MVKQQQCINAQAHQASEGLHTSLGSDVVLKKGFFLCNHEVNFMKIKPSKFYRRSSFNLKGKAVVGHPFSQQIVVTATAWDSTATSDGLGLNVTCSKFCLDAYLLLCLQSIVWCRSWLLTNWVEDAWEVWEEQPRCLWVLSFPWIRLLLRLF